MDLDTDGLMRQTNILVNDQNCAVICGFGQVKQLGSSVAHTAGLKFQPEYTAPEFIAVVSKLEKRLREDDEDEDEDGFWGKADVWSFGMIALEVC